VFNKQNSFTSLARAILSRSEPCTPRTLGQFTLKIPERAGKLARPSRELDLGVSNQLLSASRSCLPQVDGVMESVLALSTPSESPVKQEHVLTAYSDVLEGLVDRLLDDAERGGISSSAAAEDRTRLSGA
jgi:hypothetical protein